MATSVDPALLRTSFPKQYIDLLDATLQSAIDRAERLVNLVFVKIGAEAQGTDPETWIDGLDVEWTLAEKEDLIFYRAAHLASIASPVVVGGSHANTSGEISFKPGIGLRHTPFGQAYLELYKSKRGSTVSVERTG